MLKTIDRDADTIALYSGGYFTYTKPDPADIKIYDIAHALSMLCRYTGHTNFFYSVAQHSVLVSYIVPREFAFEGLMHDAHEAYIGDMNNPLKQLCPKYKQIEERVERVVRGKWKLPYKTSPIVKEADIIALATEKRDLMSTRDHWGILNGVQPHDEIIIPASSEVAKQLFLERYHELT